LLDSRLQASGVRPDARSRESEACLHKYPKRQLRQRSRFLSRGDHRKPHAAVREQNGRRGCVGHRDMHTQSRIGRRPAQLFANHPRLANQPPEAADVEGDGSLAVRFHPRREIARHL
jgi:hypothetical protein